MDRECAFASEIDWAAKNVWKTMQRVNAAVTTRLLRWIAMLRRAEISLTSSRGSD